MLPAVDASLELTAGQIVLYSLTLFPASLVPVVIGIEGWRYVTCALVLDAAFLYFAFRCARNPIRRGSAKGLFLASLLYLPCLFAGMVVYRV